MARTYEAIGSVPLEEIESVLTRKSISMRMFTSANSILGYLFGLAGSARFSSQSTPRVEPDDSLPGLWATVLVFSRLFCFVEEMYIWSSTRRPAKDGRVEWRAFRLAVSRGARFAAVWHVTEEPGHARGIVRSLPGTSVVAVVETGPCTRWQRRAQGRPDHGRVAAVAATTTSRLSAWARISGGAGSARRGNVRRLDTAGVNGVPFNNGLGIGFDAEVADGARWAPAYLGGTGRYLWSCRAVAQDFRCHEARLVIGGESSRPEPYSCGGYRHYLRSMSGSHRRRHWTTVASMWSGRGSEPGPRFCASTGGLTWHARRRRKGAYGPRARSR